MNKEQAKKHLQNIFNFIEKSEIGGYTHKHPALYFFKSKEDFEQKLNDVLKDKINLDRYDVMYYSNYLIKYLLHPDDSHTNVFPKDFKLLPIIFKYIDGDFYVIKVIDSMNDALYGKLTHINGVGIDTIKKELEDMICYSTDAHLKSIMSYRISSAEVLKSLPSINNKTNTIKYTIENNSIEETFAFNLAEEFSKIDDIHVMNYTYDLIDDSLVLHYTCCKNEERMNEFVSEIKDVSNKNNISKFILDLRGNTGGSTNVSIPLINFLEDKNVVVLIDYDVFSAAAMLCLELKKMGFLFVGTDIGTTLSCFGNIEVIDYPNLELIIRKSYKYFYYGDDLNYHIYYKDSFNNFVRSKEEFNRIDKGVFTSDIYSIKSIDDYKNGTDTPLETAINLLNNSRTYHNKN